jgi:hypothetical protein
LSPTLNRIVAALTLTLATQAQAQYTPPPQGSTPQGTNPQYSRPQYQAPPRYTQPQQPVKGHIARLAYEVAEDAQRTANTATSLMSTHYQAVVIPQVSLGGQVRTEADVATTLAQLNQKQQELDAIFNTRRNEILAVKEIIDVKEAANDFRDALAGEPIYTGRPTRSVAAFQNLERQVNEMMNNPVLRQEGTYYAPLMQDLHRTQATVAGLAKFYRLAASVGYRMAEVVTLSDHLEEEVGNMVNLARNDPSANQWREERLARSLEELKSSVDLFGNECTRLGGANRNIDVRVELRARYDDLRNRYTRLAEYKNRRNSFPPNVRAAFDRSEQTFTDLTYAFDSVD